MPTPEEWKKECRMVFNELCKTPRIRPKDASKILQMRPSSVGAIIREAIKQAYIVGPQIRKKSYKNFKEYMHFANFEDPAKLYQEYRKDDDIIHHAVLDGFCNFSFISEKHFNLEGMLISGDRTDYHISYPPNLSWSISLPKMKKMVQAFDPERHMSKNILKTHWDEDVYWTELDEILFREFKYDLRRPLAPVMKKYNIQRRVIDEWLKKVPDCCTVFTCYFPETVFAYDSCVFMFETDYEDFVIDLFSLLPTTTWFYRVSDNLFIHTWLDRGSMRSATPLEDITKLHMLTLMRELQKKEIVKNEAHATVTCYWRREPNP